MEPGVAANRTVPGTVECMTAAHTDPSGPVLMDWLGQDLRYAVRRIRRSAGFSALVILTLALGIGANTAIFSVVNAVLLRPLPYEHPDALVTILHRYPSLDLDASVSAGGFRDYRDRTRSFADVAVESGWGANLTGYGEPVRIIGSRASGDFFATLGVAAAIGRMFGPAEDVPGQHHVVVLSDGLWQRQFGADPDVLGRVILLNDEPYEIIGVMPAGFRDFFNRQGEFWVPLALTEEEFAAGRTNEWLALTDDSGSFNSLASQRTMYCSMAAASTDTLAGFAGGWTGAASVRGSSGRVGWRGGRGPSARLSISSGV